jgi:hypothetical protein
VAISRKRYADTDTDQCQSDTDAKDSRCVVARACNSRSDRLRSFALFRHAGHVTVGFKCDVMSALFEGSHAVLVEYHLLADVVIALLVFFELVSCRLYWRCWARRVIVALFWVLSLHRRHDRQREYRG